MFYDVHFFEVFWYDNKYLQGHPARVHAFGIDRRIMRPRPDVEKIWDLIFVGAMADHMGHKRPWIIGDRQGRRVAIGKQNGPEAQKVVEQLRRKGVHVMTPLPYSELALLIQAKFLRYLCFKLSQWLE